MNKKTKILELEKRYNELNVVDKMHHDSFYNQAKELYNNAKEIMHLKTMSGALSILGIHKFFKGEEVEAFSYYQESLDIAKKIKNYGLQCRNMSNMSMIYVNRGLYLYALHYQLYTEQVMKMIPQEEYSVAAFRALNGNIGVSYYKLKKYKEAEKYLNRAVDDASTDHMYSFLQSHGSLVMYYSHIGEMKKAKFHIDCMKDSVKKYNRKLYNYLVASYEGQYECGKGNIEKANELFKKALDYGTAKINVIENIDMIDCWANMLIKHKLLDDLEEVIYRIKILIINRETGVHITMHKYRYLIEKFKGNTELALAQLERVDVLKTEYNIKNQELIIQNAVYLAEMQAGMEKIADTYDKDALTGCFNRYILTDDYDEYIENIRKNKNCSSMIMLDIDCFKEYNDTYGHVKGDEVLKKIAELNFNFITPKQYFIRYGGDEFLIILPNYSEEETGEYAMKLFYAIKESNIEHNSSKAAKRVTVTMGLKSFYGEQCNNVSKCIDETDIQLYKGKANGRNCIFINDKRLLF